MPLPAIPLAAGLGSLIGGVFAGLVGFLTDFIGRKAAIATALGSFLVAGWVAIQGAVYLAWTSLGWVIPSELSVPLGFVAYLLPSNTTACIQVMVVAKIGRWLWDQQRDWARAVAMA